MLTAASNTTAPGPSLAEDVKNCAILDIDTCRVGMYFVADVSRQKDMYAAARQVKDM